MAELRTAAAVMFGIRKKAGCLVQTSRGLARGTRTRRAGRCVFARLLYVTHGHPMLSVRGLALLGSSIASFVAQVLVLSDGVVTAASGQGQHLFGLEADEIKGMPLRDILALRTTNGA